jgi:outer membrane protein assembly factor BamB
MYGHDQSRTNYNAAEQAINHNSMGNLQQLWQANVGSNGVAPSGAPIVSDGHVYVASSVINPPNFFAFDARSGARLWTANIGHKEVPCFNIGVGATPAIANNVIVEGGGDSAYYGLDANTGAQLWRDPLNVGVSGFPWASPLIVGNRAYLGVSSRCDDPSVRGEVRAVNVTTGAQEANVYFAPAGVAGAGIWNSPALSPDGGTLAVATGEDFAGANGPYTRAMVSLDPASLQIRQAHQQGATNGDLDFGTTPVVFHDASGRALVGAGHKNGTFYAYALDNISNGPIWTRATGTSVGMMPAYDPTFGNGGTLFIVSSPNIYAVDPATGNNRWAPATVGTMHGNLAIASGLIFANTGSEGVQVIDEATGSHIRTLSPPNAGSANSGVVVAEGGVYWLSGSEMNAWGLAGSAAPTPTTGGGGPAPTSTPGGQPTFADPAFQSLWTRTDSLVANHSANRSWFWGPGPNTNGLMEPYIEGKGGQRLVQYFDKSRMEINNPDADPKSAFYVTNGLLVVELISGRMQMGNNAYVDGQGANINVAGDSTDSQAPTYVSFQGVANTTLGDHKAQDRTGQSATATLARSGTEGNDASMTKYQGIDFVHYEAGVGHNIPRVFWDFLNQQGPVVENGQVVQAQLITPWFYASGLPISEPYWASVHIGGTARDVLIQAFERRVVTYTPTNNDPFKVEMGNVGQHYYDWRYRFK